MRMYDIIQKKRQLCELTFEELQFFVNGYVSGEIPDYQASALLMAICFAGMTDNETANLTKIMASSGDILDLSAFGSDSVDKHSTGGVGDKTTLIIAPIVASLGCKVAKLSGRGLGHTGGTLDKLESIKGYNTSLSSAQFMSVAEKCGICVCGAGENLVPADKKLYALRDVTATVSSIPLIVSSIMSKKLAGGANTIVLDVKTGSGAFMKTYEDSLELARRMVSIGKLSGKKVSAVITNMDRPLGRNIGNALEVAEAYNLLCGKTESNDLLEICITLSAEMVSRSKDEPFEISREKVVEVLQTGKAKETFLKWIGLQGGDISVLDSAAFSSAKYKTEVLSPADGYISSADAEGMGITAMMLGAGRQTKADVIDMRAGIIQKACVGDKVKKGEVIAILQSDTVEDHTNAAERWLKSLAITDTPPANQPLVYDIIR
ncbi:MAG: thymidine phosphorylase [Ruminococcaceae bacterium]|nr:thymidine phosphorylase [Oscillospiraceae bacterium]